MATVFNVNASSVTILQNDGASNKAQECVQKITIKTERSFEISAKVLPARKFVFSVSVDIL